MKYFSIMDLQRDSISHIRRDYWNAVVIGAILYGVSTAIGMVSSIFTFPLQLYTGLIGRMSITGFKITLDSLPHAFRQIGAMLLPYSLISLIPAVLAIAMEPANAGARLAYLDIASGNRAKADTIFSTFKSFWRFIGAALWQALFVLLWSLLFLIPGIIKGYAYFMMPYLVAEYPDLPVQDAMKLSMRITMGYKRKVFLMSLLLFAWGLLVIPAAVITCGLGGLAYSLLWISPLSGLMNAAMYNKLKLLAFGEGRITPKDLHISAQHTQM